MGLGRIIMPNNTPKEKAKRCILIEMMLAIQEALTKLGDDPEVSVVLMAVRLGHYSDRPMDIKSLAGAKSLKRTTVLRHLRLLEENKRVTIQRGGRRTIVTLDGRADIKETAPFYRLVNRVVMEAARNLSKLDTKTID
jgi:DNA-binding transcriptional ArsR family regulator